MDTLGIDIGTVSIKYVRVRGKGRKSLVISSGVFPYNGEMSALYVILSNIRAREGAQRVAIGIASQDILKKTITIPVLPNDEVREALNWTVSKSIPDQLDDMLYDYIMLGEVEERGARKLEACFVGVRKHFVDELLAAFRKSGFKNIALLTDIGFVYQEAVKEEAGSIAVVDVGGIQTGIYIFDDKKMRLVREILIAGESFSDALIDNIDVRSEEGRALIERGFREGSIGLSQGSFESFVTEVQRTFTIYDKRYPEKPVSKIYFSGRGTEIPDFAEKSRQSFAQEVRVFRSFKELQLGFLPGYVLAAHGEELVNLLPEDIKTREREAVYKKWLIAGSAGIVVVLAALSFSTLAKLSGLNASLATEKANASFMREQAKSLSTAATPARHGDLVPFMAEMKTKDRVFVMFLKYLSSHLPGGIYIKTLDFGSQKQGVSSTPRGQSAAPNRDRGSIVDDVRAQGARQTAASSAPSAKTVAGRWITITGCAVGDIDVAEPLFLGFVMKLKDTGMLYDIELDDKQAKMVGGNRVVEFTLSGRYGGD